MLLFQFEMSVYRTNGRLHGISVFGPLIVYLRQVCDRFTVPSPNLASRFLLSNVTVWQQHSRVMYVCRKPVARYVETQSDRWGTKTAIGWEVLNILSLGYAVVVMYIQSQCLQHVSLCGWLYFFKIYRFSCQQLW